MKFKINKHLVFKLGIVVLGACVSLGGVDASEIGSSLEPAIRGTRLANCYGKEVLLEEKIKGRKAIVLAFLGTECPLAKLYGPRLGELAKRFGEAKVCFLGVNSNRQDSLTELKAYAQRYDIPFEMLKDKGSRFAQQVGATRTPEVYVLDSELHVQYHGAIDNQYGVGFARDKATSHYLADALESLLNGVPIKTVETRAIGCVIGKPKELAATGNVTFHKDIEPIFNQRCVSCHREGEIGPFTLTSYEDVLGWEDTILEVIGENRMPPWNADPKYGHFANDARLSQNEKDVVRKWVQAGMPKGNVNDAPAPPVFVDGWRIGTPDQQFKMRDEPFDVPAEGVVDYKRFVVDPGWKEDVYIAAAEARPGNREIVHHILVYVILPNSDRVNLSTVLVGYAPGSLPVQLEEDQAMRLPAGSKLLFELHYTPNGTAQSDLSYAGVRFADPEKVQNLVRGHAAIENRFEIPARDSNYKVTAERRLRKDQLLLSMTPHMHLRGKAFKYEAFFPDGTSEVLLNVPQYDFNWQLKYILSEPKLLPRNTRIVCTAIFDNSEANLVNPDPNRSVTWGDQSFDEMMIGFYDTVDVD